MNPDGPEASERAAQLVRQMTEDERLDCLSGDRPFWAGLDYLAKGGYHWSPFPAAAVERLGFGGIAFSDGPRGVVVDRCTCFPVSMARGATWDRDLEVRIGEAIGKELRAVGADLYGGVCVNLLRHPGWGRAQETYGEDPHHVGEMGSALTRGVQVNAMACVKHFACNSIENSRFKVDVTVDEKPLHELFLRQFRRIVDEGAAVVMSAYNRVNGQWCAENGSLLTEILRDEWGFEGFVISDWIFGLRDAGGSLTAGLDIEMPHKMLRASHLREALDAGSVSWQDVDRAVTRILSTRMRFAAVIDDSAPIGREILACPEHVALAREAAAKSVVLLKNDEVHGETVLPMDPQRLETLALIGRLATIVNLGDGGSSDVWPPRVVTIREGVEAAIARAGGRGRVEVYDGDGHSGGADRDLLSLDPEIAADVARRADVALVVTGYTFADEGEFMDPNDMGDLLSLFPGPDDEEQAARFAERLAHMSEVVPPDHVRSRISDGGFAMGGDRRSLRLHGDDVALIRAVAAANPRTVVAIVAGGAVLISEWDESVPAIVLGWYGGMEGGNGLADVLFGSVEPGGRLPFSVPVDEQGLPEFDPDARQVVYDSWHGWWLAERDDRLQAYPFGFGLGYTSFEIEDASASLSGAEIAEAPVTVTVRVRVRNTGRRDGSDVVQVYSHRHGSDGPGRLVGFERVEIPSGGVAEIALEIGSEEFAERDVVAHEMVVPAGSYELRVARDAADPGKTLNVDLPGRRPATTLREAR